jgi:hypothetical protein
MILLACTAGGTARLPLLINLKSKLPHCFKYIRNVHKKYVANRKRWLHRPSLLTLGILCAKMSSKSERIYFSLNSVLLISKTRKLPEECETCVFPPDCTSILKPLDKRIMRSLKQYHKKLVKKTVSMIDHKLLFEDKCSGCTIFRCRIMVQCHT